MLFAHVKHERGNNCNCFTTSSTVLISKELGNLSNPKKTSEGVLPAKIGGILNSQTLLTSIKILERYKYLHFFRFFTLRNSIPLKDFYFFYVCSNNLRIISVFREKTGMNCMDPRQLNDWSAVDMMPV